MQDLNHEFEVSGSTSLDIHDKLNMTLLWCVKSRGIEWPNYYRKDIYLEFRSEYSKEEIEAVLKRCDQILEERIEELDKIALLYTPSSKLN